MMRNLIVTFAIALLLVPAVALAVDANRFDIGGAVVTDGALENEVVVPIGVDNTQGLIALDIPLSFTEGAVLKSVEFTDRVKEFDMKIASIDNDNHRVLIGFISMSKKDSPELAAGSGTIAYLHFEANDKLDAIEINPISIERPNHSLAYYYNDWSSGRPEIIGINPEVNASAVSLSGGPMTPDRYELFQNTPNPFNPSTIIKYSTLQPGHVTLKIYNVLGQEVRTLVDGYQDADVHQVSWDSKDNSGHNVASGVYFYRISTDNFTQTKKMVLLK